MIVSARIVPARVDGGRLVGQAGQTSGNLDPVPRVREVAAHVLSQHRAHRAAHPAATAVAAFDDDVALRVLAAMRDLGLDAGDLSPAPGRVVVRESA